MATSFLRTLLMKFGPSVSSMYSPQSLAKEQAIRARMQGDFTMRRRSGQLLPVRASASKCRLGFLSPPLFLSFLFLRTGTMSARESLGSREA